LPASTGNRHATPSRSGRIAASQRKRETIDLAVTTRRRKTG
jgi:hypothetical protein